MKCIRCSYGPVCCDVKILLLHEMRMRYEHIYNIFLILENELKNVRIDIKPASSLDDFIAKANKGFFDIYITSGYAFSNNLHNSRESVQKCLKQVCDELEGKRQPGEARRDSAKQRRFRRGKVFWCEQHSPFGNPVGRQPASGWRQS